MTPGTRLALVLTVLLGTTAALAWPERTIAPGPLHAGHDRLATDCLACHVPFSGPSAAKCLSCHALNTIGVQTTAGVTLSRPRPRTSLVHRALVDTGKACDTCHGEHQRGPAREMAFEHGLFPDAVRANCVACHDADRPGDALHRQVAAACGSCHGSRGWRPARFSHDALPTDQQAACEPCHASKRPGDTLHASAGEACAACHGTQAWKPATFAHDRFFRFDRHHPPACATCHQAAGTFRSYTCYGCHEHTPAKMQAEHRRQQGQDLDRCARCHRSADEHGAEGAEGGRESARGQRQESRRERGEHRERERR